MGAIYAEPSRQLKNIWLEWITLHRCLQRNCPDVSSPFFSAMGATSCRKRVMLVGKATREEWGASSYRGNAKPGIQAIRERLYLNRDFIEKGGTSSGFWAFFFRLAAFGPGVDGMIWSNVAKLASNTGRPPRGRLLREQADLAQRTLREEVREYRPSLVVFVTENYAERIITNAFGFTKQGWKKDRNGTPDDEVWWLCSTPDFPSVRFLWLRHPQGKTTEQIQYWTVKAKELLFEK